MTPIDLVLSRLKGVTGKDGQWKALCPAHADHRQSLSVSIGSDQKVLLKCHAMCKIEDIVAALNLEMADLFVKTEERSVNGNRTVATYNYVDEDGKLLYQVVRKANKTFPQRRPDGNGGWVWNLNGTEKVLYRLPELLASGEQWVFICEGEKSTEAIRNLGLTATTSPMGAGKWRTKYATVLADRKVCILPDNDKAGRLHAEQVARTLPQAVILELPGLGEEEDPFDWVARGGTEDELMELTEKSNPVCVPPYAPCLLEEGADDAGNAFCMNALHEGEFLYCEAYGFLSYDGRCWNTRLAKSTLTQLAVEMLKSRQHAAVEAERESITKAAKPSAYNVRSCIELYKSLVCVDVSEFDKSLDLINCQNGVLDLRTGELTPHSPDQRFTYCIPVEYNPNADSTEWTQWLSKTAGGEKEVVGYIQAAVGYSLTGHTNEECLFYIHGPTRGGKGVFIETILAMLGRQPLAAEVDFRTFAGRADNDTQNFALAPLKPCRFVAASESAKNHRLKTERVKIITGGNDIRCAFKGKTHFSYRPQFKMWLSSNYPINADPEDAALWSRVKVITFPNSHLGSEDKRLKQKMRSPKMLSGILTWAVAGAIYWYSLGATGLDTPAIVAEQTKSARDDLDYVKQWIEECVSEAEAPDTFTKNEAIRQSYEDWCKRNGIKYTKGSTALTQSLKNREKNAGVLKKIAGQVFRGCTGIELG